MGIAAFTIMSSETSSNSSPKTRASYGEGEFKLSPTAKAYVPWPRSDATLADSHHGHEFLNAHTCDYHSACAATSALAQLTCSDQKSARPLDVSVADPSGEDSLLLLPSVDRASWDLEQGPWNCVKLTGVCLGDLPRRRGTPDGFPALLQTEKKVEVLVPAAAVDADSYAQVMPCWVEISGQQQHSARADLQGLRPSFVMTDVYQLDSPDLHSSSPDLACLSSFPPLAVARSVTATCLRKTPSSDKSLVPAPILHPSAALPRHSEFQSMTRPTYPKSRVDCMAQLENNGRSISTMRANARILKLLTQQAKRLGFAQSPVFPKSVHELLEHRSGFLLDMLATQQARIVNGSQQEVEAEILPEQAAAPSTNSDKPWIGLQARDMLRPLERSTWHWHFGHSGVVGMLGTRTIWDESTVEKQEQHVWWPEIIVDHDTEVEGTAGKEEEEEEQKRKKTLKCSKSKDTFVRKWKLPKPRIDLVDVRGWRILEDLGMVPAGCLDADGTLRWHRMEATGTGEPVLQSLATLGQKDQEDARDTRISVDWLGSLDTI